MNRHFTVAVFLVHSHKILLLKHKKLNMWLPPGGHVDPNELPDEAAVREVKEETGLNITLVGEKGLNVNYPRQLIIPRGIQVEDIEADHQHINLVYFATLSGNPRFTMNKESTRMDWYGLDDLPLDVNDEIRSWCKRAFSEIETKL